MFKLQVKVEDAATIMVGKAAMKSLMRAAGNQVAAKARALIRQKTSSGKVRVSVAGAPPVSRSGLLASSIKVLPWRNGNGVSVRDTAFYALFLEVGASGGGNPGAGNMPINPKTGKPMRAKGRYTKRVLLPHPFLSTALDEVTAGGNLGQKIADAVAEGVQLTRGPP